MIRSSVLKIVLTNYFVNLIWLIFCKGFDCLPSLKSINLYLCLNIVVHSANIGRQQIWKNCADICVWVIFTKLIKQIRFRCKQFLNVYLFNSTIDNIKYHSIPTLSNFNNHCFLPSNNIINNKLFKGTY